MIPHMLTTFCEVEVVKVDEMFEAIEIYKKEIGKSIAHERSRFMRALGM